MKLAAIYNVWDGVELLKGSMDCLHGHVDLFIIVYQDVSNFGEQYDPLPEMILPESDNIILVKYTPQQFTIGAKNETEKRNTGIEIAKKEQCTHFILMDCDEYYTDFGAAKQQYIAIGLPGSVCRIMTYFKKPTLRLQNPDNYYVPFIHRLTQHTWTGCSNYPYYVDPTRRIKCAGWEMQLYEVIEINSYMHHFSWVRKDIGRKVRNSSARKNIERSQLMQDYNSPELGAGFFLKDYRQPLVEVDDVFGIGDF